MSSYGGETPVDTVSENLVGNTTTIYTVPSGKYFKGVIFGHNGSGNQVDVIVDSLTINEYGNAENLQLEVILHSGQVLGTSSPVSTTVGKIQGLLYNNPSPS